MGAGLHAASVIASLLVGFMLFMAGVYVGAVHCASRTSAVGYLRLDWPRRRCAEGDYDDVDEQAFYLIGDMSTLKTSSHGEATGKS